MYNIVKKELMVSEISHFVLIFATEGREIIVKTNDDEQQLIYEFDTVGRFIRMYYAYGNYEERLVSALTHSIKYGEFTNIFNYRGTATVKVGF